MASNTFGSGSFIATEEGVEDLLLGLLNDPLCASEKLDMAIKQHETVIKNNLIVIIFDATL